MDIRIRSYRPILSCLHIRCLYVTVLLNLRFQILFCRQIFRLLTQRTNPRHTCARSPSILYLYSFNPTMRISIVHIAGVISNTHAYIRSISLINNNFSGLNITHHMLPCFNGLLLSVSIHILLNLGLSCELVRHLENLNSDRFN